MPSRRLLLNAWVVLSLVASVLFVTFALYQGRLYSEHSFMEPARERVTYVETPCSAERPIEQDQPVVMADDTPKWGRLIRRNIVVASMFPHHFDVYMALVWTLQRVLEHLPGTQIRVFAAPFNYGFQSLVEQLGIYRGKRHNSDQLLSFLAGEDGRTVDMVILGTCEVDLRTWHAALLSEWDSRSSSHKFQLVCIVHNAKDTAWQVHITDWARRGAIRLLPIAEHVKTSFRRLFDQHAESANHTLYSAGYENIPIDVHVPVLHLPNLPVKNRSRILSKAVIQGTFDVSRRDYPHIFDDLVSALHEDAAAWGYRPLDGHKYFIPDHRAATPPFELALVGAGTIEIPEELAYMVTVYRDLPYEAFYKLIAGMDIVVPAFADFASYYEDQASSTVALATQLNVPILVTERMRRAYGYIDDDRVVVTRPAAMREVHALKTLRTGDMSSFLQSDPTSSGYSMAKVRGAEEGVRAMFSKGWLREYDEVNRFKRELWHRNEEVVERMLRDL
ncbi:hypothetical protein NM688_g815 [Phlebia brevispora]|uniref:Uncharacterized protein n=1 Tax=Phlebia brevispora TaxID=194682 RepID=A0ACC1TDL8_9APHY|nr:hypothetical protein NM688_g815 [Phlebia brevispora]